MNMRQVSTNSWRYRRVLSLLLKLGLINHIEYVAAAVSVYSKSLRRTK